MTLGKGSNAKAFVIHAMRPNGATYCENAVRIGQTFDGDWDSVTCKYCLTRKLKKKRGVKL